MIQPTVGFIVYGVHKDGLKDPMGAPFIDYLIADASAVPDSERGNFTEHVLHLPGSFFPIDNTRRIAQGYPD